MIQLKTHLAPDAPSTKVASSCVAQSAVMKASIQAVRRWYAGRLAGETASAGGRLKRAFVSMHLLARPHWLIYRLADKPVFTVFIPKSRENVKLGCKLMG